MIRGWLGSALAGAVLLAGVSPSPAQGAPLAIDAAAPGGVSIRFKRAGAAHAQLLGGTLTAPSSAAPAQVAAAYLAARPEILGGVAPSTLRLIDTRALAGTGASVRYTQTFGGVDVLGGDVFVRIDTQGRVRWAKSATRTIPADFDVSAAVTPAAAVALIQNDARLHLRGVSIPTSQARLMIDVTLPGAPPRLVYVVLAPGNLYLREAWRVRVDARTGAVVAIENRVKTANAANVFTNNPAKTPNLVQVPFGPWLTPGQNPVFLQGADVKVMNCLERHQCTDLDFGGNTVSVHTCTIVQNQQGDASGNFLSVQRPASDLDGEDAFAEVQMFYHVNQIYEFFRSFGFTNLVDRPLLAVTNLRTPFDASNPLTIPAALCTNGMPAANAQLYGFDNAFFTPDAMPFTGTAGGGIVFGQGTKIDFAYDGDVVYHEFTHAVMGSLTPAFGANSFDEFGEDPTTGGMNEGTADYFSSALANDPDVGEYAGPPLLNDPNATALRHLTNDKTCPSSLWNEVHQDGEEWGGALWDVRATLPVGQQHTYDQAVYNAIATLVPDDDQISTAAAIAAEVNTLLGASARDLAVTKYAARGLDDCDDRGVDMNGGPARELLFITGVSQELALQPVPGPLQFKLDVPAGTRQILVNITKSGGGAPGAAPAMKLIARPGAAAIHWTYSEDATTHQTTATHDASASADIVCNASMACTGSIGGDITAGPYVLQIINEGAGATLQGVTLAVSDMAGPPDAGPPPDAAPTPTPDAAPTPTPDAAPTPGPDAGNPNNGDGDGGCGCRVGGASQRAPLGGRLALAGLAAFLIVLARRRRR